LFIARANKEELVEIYVSNIFHGFLDFEKVTLPDDAIVSKSFTVMDTSEHTVFLHIQNHGHNTPLGNIFISDGSGKAYSLSLENVMRGSEMVDFEKINSLEGVFVANRFNVDHTHDESFHDKFQGKKKTDLTESEVNVMLLEQMRRKQSQNIDSSINAKQKKTRESLNKEGDEFELKELEKNIRTYITHNKGGKWELLRAPT
jgi:hypothetical protein